jgi:hypothetical protein
MPLTLPLPLDLILQSRVEWIRVIFLGYWTGCGLAFMLAAASSFPTTSLPKQQVDRLMQKVSPDICGSGTYDRVILLEIA